MICTANLSFLEYQNAIFYSISEISRIQNSDFHSITNLHPSLLRAYSYVTDCAILLRIYKTGKHSLVLMHRNTSIVARIRFGIHHLQRPPLVIFEELSKHSSTFFEVVIITPGREHRTILVMAHPEAEVFDIIMVGGCVVASRLRQQKIALSILILKAGEELSRNPKVYSLQTVPLLLGSDAD
jgi:hypothetical protein